MFEDERGVIQDLITEPIDSVTRITTVKDAVRGNHWHGETWQWTLVLSGTLRIADPRGEQIVGPGQIVKHRPGLPHAWKAIENSECLVFTRGPRAGENYEEDTYRLTTPLLT